MSIKKVTKFITISTFFILFTAYNLYADLLPSNPNNLPDSIEVSFKPTLISIKHPELYQYFRKEWKIELDHKDNLSLYSMIKRWLHTPYRWAGTSFRGVDCQGLVAIMNDTVFCNTLPRGAGNQYLVTEPIKKNDLKEGDLVFFKIGSYHISHVGMYLKDNKFVHSTTALGVIISDLDEPYYKRWFFSGGRIKKGSTLEIEQNSTH